MEFNLASNGTNNSYFDRIIQTKVEADLKEISYCLQLCKIAQDSYRNPLLSFSQRLCIGTPIKYLDDCTKIMSIDISKDEEDSRDDYQ